MTLGDIHALLGVLYGVDVAHARSTSLTDHVSYGLIVRAAEGSCSRLVRTCFWR